jgi:nicotinamide-nucleotide amidase
MRRALDAVEIVSVGDELLSGATIDSNGACIGRALEPLGVRVVRKTTVGDDAAAIIAAVGSALERTGAVITTGGLGPTPDDITKEAVAEALGRELEFREDLWQRLLQRWAHRGRIPETNRRQAEVPAGAETFHNPRGTAPGLAVDDQERGLCILLPGPPDELEHLLINSVVPYLAARTRPDARRPYRRFLRTVGIAESAIAERIGAELDDLSVDVAFLPEFDGNDIRLTGWATEEDEIAPALREAVARLQRTLGDHIYGEGEVELADVVGQLLQLRGLKVAVAESCTAGLIAKRLTDRSGSSEYFWGGAVVYDDQAKVGLLGVEEETILQHGAVSEETAREMVEGICRRSGVEAGIAVTGIAGPTGGTEEKPVGTVWLAARLGDETVTARRYYPGERDIVRARAAQGALDLLRRTLIQELK